MENSSENSNSLNVPTTNNLNRCIENYLMIDRNTSDIKGLQQNYEKMQEELEEVSKNFKSIMQFRIMTVKILITVSMLSSFLAPLIYKVVEKFITKISMQI